MGRVILLSLLLVGSGAAAQAPGAPPTSKHLRLPPIEGVTKPLPKAFDLAPVLRFDGDTDCGAYAVKISAQAPPPPAAAPPPSTAKPAERLDGCFIMRRETTDPFERPARVDPDRMI